MANLFTFKLPKNCFFPFPNSISIYTNHKNLVFDLLSIIYNGLFLYDRKSGLAENTHKMFLFVYFCRNLSNVEVNNVLDLLDEGDSSHIIDQLDDEDKVGVSYVNITVVPPTEDPMAATDEDSDGSDGEIEGDFLHLPRKILTAGAQLTVGKKQISVFGEKIDVVEVSIYYIH